MAMLPPPPTIPITLPWQSGFSRGGKKEDYAKPRTEVREVSYGKIGLTTVAETQDLLSGMPLVLKIELIRLWNSLLPEPGHPSAQLSKLIRHTACKKAMHAISWWYRTVYIPWLVASYDTHKGKRWLNSNPPNHRGHFNNNNNNILIIIICHAIFPPSWRVVMSCQIILPQLPNIHLLVHILGTFTFIFNSCALCQWKI